MYWYCLITELLRSHFAKLTWCSGGSWSETKALHTPRSCIWGSCRTSFDFCSFAKVFGILVLHFADLCYLIGDIWDVPALRHFWFHAFIPHTNRWSKFFLCPPESNLFRDLRILWHFGVYSPLTIRGSNRHSQRERHHYGESIHQYQNPHAYCIILII